MDSVCVRPARWVGVLALVLVALPLCTLRLPGEDAPAGESGPTAGLPEKSAKVGGVSKAAAGDAAAPPTVTDFRAEGAGVRSQVGDLTCDVKEGALKVVRGEASLTFEHLSLAWGKDVRALAKPAPAAAGKSATTDRGGGHKEVVKAGPGGFETDLIIEAPGGPGDLVLKSRVETELTLEETFFVDDPAASFDYRGDLIFMNAGGERVLRVSRTWVLDAAGRREICVSRVTRKPSGLELETTVPAAWLKSATYPVTIDPVIGSPVDYSGGGNLDDWPTDVAFGSNVYFMVWLLKVSPTTFDLKGRIFNGSGSGGSSFLLVGGITPAADARVAYCSDSSGRFAVLSPAANPSNGQEGIWSRLFNASGSSQGNWFLVANSATTTQLTEADICSNGTNRFLYTWGGATASGIHQLYGELRSDTGALIKDDTLLEAATGSVDLGFPASTYNSSASQWIVAYDSVDSGVSGSPHELRTTCWNSGLTSKAWGPITVAAGGGESHERCSTAINPTNAEVMLTWTRISGTPSVREVRARRMNFSGTLLGGEFAVESHADQSQRPTVGYILDSNRYVVLFESTSDAATTGGIYGQLILNDGALWQPRFVVQDLPTYYETAPCVCRGSLSEYEFLACWKGPPDGGTDSETWVVMLDISPPPIPTGLGATPGDQQVALNWTAVGGGAQLAGYNVYYQVTGAGTWTQANGAVVTGTTYTVASLTNGTNYTFAVSSLDTHENESAKSATVAATPVDGVAPAAPTGLAATTSSATVHLTWTANGEADLAGYDVYRSLTEGGVYTKVNAALVLTPAYSDGGRTNGVTYWYYVVAKDTSGNASLASARISAVPAYSIPAGLTLDSNGIASVSMHWSAVSEPDLAGYLVYRGTASGGPYTQITPSPLAGTSFIDTGLAAGTYYYVVTAKSTGAEESAWSNQIVGTPTEVPAPDLDAANERKTNDQTPLLTGTSVAGFIVRIYEGATLLGEGTAGAGGAFSVASTVVLAEGVHTIHATATTPGAGGITSGASAGVDVAIDLTPPAPPANVRVVAGNAWAEVSWDPNTEADIHGYNVYRRTGGGAWTKLNANPLVNSRYLDRPVTNGTAYEYKVTAVDDTLDED